MVGKCTDSDPGLCHLQIVDTQRVSNASGANMHKNTKGVLPGVVAESSKLAKSYFFRLE